MTLGRDGEVAAESADLPDASAVLDKDNDEDVRMAELFDEEFMPKYTDFETFDEMVQASPSDAMSGDKLDLVPDGEWDEFVAETTLFDNEEEMVLTVRDHWVAKKLDLDI